MMRSPGATFDLRAALSDEIRAAIEALDASPVRPKTVHRCRVHLKRARSLARVGHACAPGLASVFNESARTIMRVLAQAQELSALADAARALAKKTGKKSRAALHAVADHFDAARLSLPALNLESVRAGLKDLLALAQVWPEASARQIYKGAERIARRARRARRRGRASHAALRRHEWRKREKDRLYAVTLLERAWPEERKRRRKLGEALGDLLGRERDALILIERIEAEPALAGPNEASQRALAALAGRRAKLARKADGLGERLHAGRA